MIVFFFKNVIGVFNFSDPISIKDDLDFSFSSNSISICNALFYGLSVIGNSVIFMNNTELECLITLCSFDQCKSDIGTCGMILQSKKEVLHKLCFSNFIVNYRDPIIYSGTALLTFDSNFDICDISMMNIVHREPKSQSSIDLYNSIGEICRLNHSFGTMRNGYGYTNSWCLFTGTVLKSSYCGFYCLEGGHCLNIHNGKEGNLHHIIFNEVTANQETAMINNPRATFFIDDCTCVNCGPVYANSVTLFRRWYFVGDIEPGDQFIDVVYSKPFDFTVKLNRRCDKALRVSLIFSKRLFLSFSFVSSVLR